MIAPSALMRVVGAVIAVCAVAAWIFWPILAPPAPEVSIAPPAAPVAKSAKVDTPLQTRTVKAHKPAAKKRLGLSKAIQADPAKVVLDSVDVKGSRQGLRLTTVMDTSTGETLTLTEKRPLPWLAPAGMTRIWLGAGIKPVGPVVRGEIERGLFSVKEWRASGRGTVDVPVNGGQVDWFLGAGIGREFD